MQTIETEYADGSNSTERGEGDSDSDRDEAHARSSGMLSSDTEDGGDEGDKLFLEEGSGAREEGAREEGAREEERRLGTRIVGRGRIAGVQPRKGEEER